MLAFVSEGVRLLVYSVFLVASALCAWTMCADISFLMLAVLICWRHIAVASAFSRRLEKGVGWEEDFCSLV
jgi:hypothetical protein